jgi:hypothetical protein
MGVKGSYESVVSALTGKKHSTSASTATETTPLRPGANPTPRAYMV